MNVIAVTVPRDRLSGDSLKPHNCCIVMPRTSVCGTSHSLGLAAGTNQGEDLDGLKTHPRVEEENEGSR